MSRTVLALSAICLLPMISCTSAPAKPLEGSAFTCNATAVWDGDGPIWCEEGPRIRLRGIAAREIDGTCRPGHPCSITSGTAARDRLVTLLGGETGRLRSGHVTVAPVGLSCTSDGESYGREVADCRLPDGRDLSCEMVASGAALKWQRYWGDKQCG